MTKVIRPSHETNENPKCHLHIPNLGKGIYVLNVIIQNILEKKKMNERDPKGTSKVLMPLVRV
jgi:hypothetical protein